VNAGGVLKFPSVVGLVARPAEEGTGDGGIGLVRDEAVRRVVRLHAELQPDALGQVEALRERAVDVPVVGPGHPRILIRVGAGGVGSGDGEDEIDGKRSKI
jgi:hypothetical protein